MSALVFGHPLNKPIHVFLDGVHATHKTTILQKMKENDHPVSLGDFSEACFVDERMENKHNNATLSKIYDLGWYRQFVEVDKCADSYFFHDRSLFSGELYDAIRRCHANLSREPEMPETRKAQIVDKAVSSYTSFVKSLMERGFAPPNHFYVFLRVDPADYKKVVDVSLNRNNGLDIMDELYVELEDRFFLALAAQLGARAKVVTTKLDAETDRLVEYLLLAMTNEFIFAMAGHVNENDNSVDLLVANDTEVVPGTLTAVDCSTSVLFGTAYNGTIIGKSSNSTRFAVHPGLVDPFYMLPLKVNVFVPKLEGSIETMLLKKDERIAQVHFNYMPSAVVVPARPLRLNLTAVSRGGFGSTAEHPRTAPIEEIRALPF